MRVVAAQHVAYHARALDRFGPDIALGPAKAQTHAAHGVQNAPLHRLLAIGHVRQRPALDHTQGVFKVSVLGVAGQAGAVVGLWQGRRRAVKNKFVGHGLDSMVTLIIIAAHAQCIRAGG